MGDRFPGLALLGTALVCLGATCAADGFRTKTFGNSERCEVRGVLQADAGSIRFDLSALSPEAQIWRAVLRVSPNRPSPGTRPCAMDRTTDPGSICATSR